jgi:Tol biopolymer transport system component
VAAAALTVAALNLGDEPVSLQVTRDILTTVEGQEFRELGGSGGLNSTALSPDGRVLVYQGPGASGPSMGVGQLWRRPLDALEATPIPGTEGASTPEFSEDGAFLSFLIRESDRLGAIPAQGGTPVWLDDSGAFRHAWGDDGAIHWIAGGRLHRWVPGTAEAEVSDYEAGRWRVSDVLPGSRALLVFGEGAIGVLDRASGEGRELGLGLRPKYLADGHIVFAREDGTLLVQPFDTRSLTTTGPAVSTPAVVRRQGGAGAEYAVAPDGTLVYQLFVEESDHRLMWVDRSGGAEAVNVAIPEGAVFDGVSFDPTGLRAAVGIRGSEGGFGQGDIWVLNLEDGTALVLTRDGTSVRPDWHPTEARIAYVGRGDEGPTARWIAADGSGTGEHLVDLNSGAPPQVRWAADGRELLLRMAGVSARSIFRYLPGQDGPPEPWLDGAFNQVDPRPSPDGAWVAYTSDRSGREEVYVRPYAEGGGVTQISTSGGTAPRWSGDGSEIFFGSDGNLWTAAVSADASGFRVDSRVQLFSADFVGDFVGYDVAPGGGFLMVVRPPSRAASRGGELVLVRNWVGEVLGGR